ncbi:hypothetical protein CDD81_4837 [Ophiocordyceps australis]|uniref:AMP-binding enzyme C-terminal domain-containing protein n=1 Tax=Ophiocordyceps australis TaxID=1399860 RepID=A0A2C5Y9C3_9HYPO|nr:hypothetical protein CDD81_4837 [Ophiocordyceps australis]
MPHHLKGQLPFAFVTLTALPAQLSAAPRANISLEIQALVRKQVGAIASLGGIVYGKDIIPRTRSGKPLRRVLRQLLEQAVDGKLDGLLGDSGGEICQAQKRVKEFFDDRRLVGQAQQ